MNNSDNRLIIKLNLKVLDYPTAWAIQKDRGTRLMHDELCSSLPGNPMRGPHFLCDCGAVRKEWERIRSLVTIQ